MNNQQDKVTGMLEPPILTSASVPFDWWADTAENIWITLWKGQ